MPTLSPHQEGAVRGVGEWFRSKPSAEEFFYLGGYAGTGKSTILPCIIDSLNIRIEEVAFCAPTGKAAKVMTEKLRAFGIRSIATTIHSLIYIPNSQRVDILMAELDALTQRVICLQDKIIKGLGTSVDEHELGEARGNHDAVERELDEALATARSSNISFSLNEKSTLFGNTAGDGSSSSPKRLIVVDEASMVGLTIARDLMSFGIPILAIGDPGQLPPVRDEAGFTDGSPDYFLTEIHRQAKDNPIIHLSEQARQGRTLRVGNYGDNVRVIERIKDDVTYDPDFAAQVICGTNKRRWMITRRLRETSLKLPPYPTQDEPLIVRKNNKTPFLVNGEFVKVVSDAQPFVKGSADFSIDIKTEDGYEYAVRAVQGLFEEHAALEKGFASCSPRTAHVARIKNIHLDYGWVITCHGAQGSQWHDVIVHDEASAFREDAAKWRYTAVTRASHGLHVIL